MCITQRYNFFVKTQQKKDLNAKKYPGKSEVRYGAAIQAVVNYLRTSEKPGSLDKTDKHRKREETESILTHLP
jgi:hypothetical protein